MTCAAHVQAIGQGFPGQLGVFADKHIEGLSHLAATIKAHESIAICQLHHAGMRSPEELIGTRAVSPSDDEKTGARGLSTEEVEQLVQDFIAAAVRCEKAGFRWRRNTWRPQLHTVSVPQQGKQPQRRSVWWIAGKQESHLLRNNRWHSRSLC